MNTKHTPGPWATSRDAVPDLLAALEQITNLAYRLAMKSPTLNPEVDTIIPMARAVIARARGR